MLALGMAFIEQPRLLMIDELSLGLAPTIVEQLLPLVRDFAAQRHDRDPRRAVGEPRARRSRRPRTSWRRARSASTARPPSCSNGPTCCARCSSKAPTRHAPAPRRLGTPTSAATVHATRARAVDRTGDDHARATATATGDGETERAGDPPRSSQAVETLRRPRRARRRDVRRRGAARSSGSSGRTARARPRCSTRSPDSSRSTAARSSFGEGDDAHDVTRMPPAPARPARARPLVPGRPALPVAHRRRDGGARVRTPPRGARPVRRRAAPPVRDGGRGRTLQRRVEELLELLGITDFRDKLGRELSTGSRRIVDLACVLAHGPSVLLLDEPSSGIAQREAEALGPLLLRIRERDRRDAARDRARRAAPALDRRPARSRSIWARS